MWQQSHSKLGESGEPAEREHAQIHTLYLLRPLEPDLDNASVGKRLEMWAVGFLKLAAPLH